VQGDNVAYHNRESGVKITHFPVIHCRQGSIGYMLEWNGLSMIYTSDTRPETLSVNHAINGGEGVDVFIHEMGLPPEVWTMKNLHLPEPLPYNNPNTPWWDEAVEEMTRVVNSSHSPQGALGYLFSLINPRPRLTVATHFPVADDTVDCALKSVQAHCPDIQWGKDFIWSFDLMVIRVTKDAIIQQKGRVPDFGFSPTYQAPEGDLNTPKYWTWKVDENGNLVLDENEDPIPVGDPRAQIETSTEIPAGDDTYCEDGY